MKADSRRGRFYIGGRYERRIKVVAYLKFVR
jgi:hypothetical protein